MHHLYLGIAPCLKGNKSQMTNYKKGIKRKRKGKKNPDLEIAWCSQQESSRIDF